MKSVTLFHNADQKHLGHTASLQCMLKTSHTDSSCGTSRTGGGSGAKHPGETVLKYLARYMTGGPISNRRLVGHQDGRVTFSARKGLTSGGSDATEPVVVPGVEFVRLWAMHILPKGYTKARCYGGYSNHHRKRYLSECRAFFSISETPVDRVSTETEDNVPVDLCCPKCESIMTRTRTTDRPGWRLVMSSCDRPIWYDDG
jgi:Putative transposase